MSQNGLLTTVCYQLGSQSPVYALEGSIAVTGSLVQWVRDNLGLIGSAPEIEALAGTVEDNGGCYFVPAFSGLFAPYWRSDARGAIVGLTRYVHKGHLARAVLEATAFQTREVIDAMNADSGVPLTSLKVDGGMVGNELLMQFQADILGVPVIRPVVAETTALGAAYAAGLAVGFWPGEDDIRNNWAKDKEWTPSMDDAAREKTFGQWKKAVTRSMPLSRPRLTIADRPDAAGGGRAAPAVDRVASALGRQTDRDEHAVEEADPGAQQDQPVQPQEEREDPDECAEGNQLHYTLRLCNRVRVLEHVHGEMMTGGSQTVTALRPDAGRPEAAGDSPFGPDPSALEHENLLHGDDVALHPGDLRDTSHLARAVRHA